MQPADVPVGPLLVDTDVFSFVHYRRDRYVDFEPFLLGRALLVAFCTVGELRAGAIKRKWVPPKRSEQERYIAAYTVVQPTTAAVDEYAALHAQLHYHLKGGGVNDMWTAAIALALNVPVVTNNRSAAPSPPSRLRCRGVRARAGA